MLKLVLSVLVILSLFFGIVNGKMNEVNLAALNSASRAVELCLTLIGTMAFWNGLMRVAQTSGLCQKISKLLSPLLAKIFVNTKKDSHAMELISINVTANLLGLANASTPLGIAALQELSRSTAENKIGNEVGNETGNEASDDMISLVVLNTASIQLIPTTVAILRLKYGSTTPLDILPAVIISSVLSLTASLLVAKISAAFSKRKRLQRGLTL